jgi:hypothetical protein
MLEASSTNDCEIIDSTPHAVDYGYHFFTPSTTKLVVMSICTLGAYEFYWFYKNWSILKNAGRKCNPLLRSLFSPLFAYSCFREIRKLQIKNNVHLKFPITFLSITYFILTMTSILPDPYWLTSFLTFLPVVLANKVALAINQVQFPGFISNDKFSKWNWFGIILGGIVLVLAVLGAFLPEV